MSVRFENKKVFVTGAACGIGYEICRQFALEGARVGLNARRQETSETSSKKINEELSNSLVSPYPADLSNVAAIQKSVNDFAEENGGIDIFVANAGITVFERFENILAEDFSHLMDVNMRGTYFSVQAAAKQMIKNGTKGRIILMSSVCGVQAHRNTSAYGMTKAAIIQLARSLSEELGDYGITVNVVAPGATQSERTLEDPNYTSGWKSVSPSRTVGTPADIAHTTLFLADEKSAHITGETIMVDGGWTATSPLPQHLEKELKPQ